MEPPLTVTELFSTVPLFAQPPKMLPLTMVVPLVCLIVTLLPETMAVLPLATWPP